MTHKIQIPEGTARRMQLRQVWGDLLWKRSREPERSVDSRRQLPDADDFSSPAPELVGDAAVADHVALAFAVPEGAVGFRAGVALGAVVPTASSVRRRCVKCQDATPHSSGRCDFDS